MADIRVSWVRGSLPAVSPTVHVAWARLRLPSAAGGGALFLFDTPKAAKARAGANYEDFNAGTDQTDAGAPQRALAGDPTQATPTVAGVPLTVVDRQGAVRATTGPAQSISLLTPGAPPLSATLPPFTVEIDADPDTGGDFVLNTSTLNGTDTMSPDVRWVAVPAADVLTIGIRRGRSREDQAVDVGTCTIVLDGYTGAYDPDNTGTLYQLAGDVKLRSGMGVRVKVTVGAAGIYLFTGALEGTQVDHGRGPTVTWTAVDRLADLGQAAFAPVDYSRAGELSSDRVDWLLDYAGIPDGDRLVTTGTRTLVGTEGGGTVLSNLENVALSEQGRVYANRLDQVVVSQHWENYAEPVRFTLSDSGLSTVVEYDAVTIEPGAAQVINDVQVKRTTKVTMVAEDGTSNLDTIESVFNGISGSSVERFGKRSLSGGQGVEAFLSSDAEMQALADYLATRRAVPASRASAVTMSLAGLSTTLLASVCNLDLGDRVALARTTADGRSLTWSLYAEGIDHTISTTGWDLTLSTAPIDDASLGAAAFRLNVSTLNGSDLLATF